MKKDLWKDPGGFEGIVDSTGIQIRFTLEYWSHVWCWAAAVVHKNSIDSIQRIPLLFLTHWAEITHHYSLCSEEQAECKPLRPNPR